MISNSKKIGLIIVSLVVVFTLLLLLSKVEKKKIIVRDFADIKKSGRLNVITDKSSFGFCVKDGKIGGFNYELIRAFADSAGLELEISEKNDLDSCIDGIKNGEYDIIAVCLPTTKEMKSKLAFPVQIYASRQMLISNSELTKISDSTNYNFLSRDSICIPFSSPHKFRLENLSNEIAKPIKIVEMRGKTSEDLVKMVSERKIKYTTCDELQARKLQKTYPNIIIETAVGFNQPMTWGVSPYSKELVNQLNDFLNDFLNSSDYWDIYRRYF